MEKGRKLVAILFIIIALILGAYFYTQLEFPIEIQDYFKKAYYSQFGPLAICVELFSAGLLVFKKHEKANFALALFAFTIIADVIFNLAGLFTSSIPLAAVIILSACGLAALYMSFTNAFNLGKISWLNAVWSFVLGNAVELFFNYF